MFCRARAYIDEITLRPRRAARTFEDNGPPVFVRARNAAVGKGKIRAALTAQAQDEAALPVSST